VTSANKQVTVVSTVTDLHMCYDVRGEFSIGEVVSCANKIV
jgi:hypothetical protein